MPVATIGPVSVITVLLIALVVLGPKRATELGRSAINAVLNFREALDQNEPTPSHQREGSAYGSEQRRLERANRTP